MIMEKSLFKRMFFYADGTFSWTAFAAAYGFVMVTLLFFDYYLFDRINEVILSWSLGVLPVLLGIRPAQKGLEALSGVFGGLKDSKRKRDEVEQPAKQEPVKRPVRQTVASNFSIEEFDCSDGTPVPARYKRNVEKLIKQLEVIRSAAGDKKITISSGYRTEAVNVRAKGAENSQHLTASAADFKVEGMTAKNVQQLVERLMDEGLIVKGGIGQAKTYTHYDIRGVKTKWVYKK